jgi:hypothetical protein
MIKIINILGPVAARWNVLLIPYIRVMRTEMCKSI